MSEQNSHFVAVIGAGPAGLFAARELATQGVSVVLFNRDIKPGGLAEYGIYPDKLTMKEGLRKQFHQVLGNANLSYFGNVKIGANGDLTLDDLRQFGFPGHSGYGGSPGHQMAWTAWGKPSGCVSCQGCGLPLQQAASIQPVEIPLWQAHCHYRGRKRDGRYLPLPDPRNEG